jgi:hypothetical protein
VRASPLQAEVDETGFWLGHGGDLEGEGGARRSWNV